MKARWPRIVIGVGLALGVAASCSSSSNKKTQIVPDADAGESGEGGAAGAAQPNGGNAGEPVGSGESGESGSGGSAGDALGGAGGDGGEAGSAGDGTSGGGTSGGSGGASSGAGGSSAGTAGAGQGAQGGSSGSGGNGGSGGACCAPADYQAKSGVLPSAACPQWEAVDSAVNEVPSISANTLRIATTTDAENMYYLQQAPHLTVPATYTIEAKIRLVSGAGSTASRAPAAIAFSFGPTHQKNILQLSTNQVFILNAENTKGDAFTFDTTNQFHIYKIVVNTAQQTLQVFVDGILELSGNTFADPSAASDYIIFGEQSVYAYGISYWEYVTHNAYVCN